MKAEDQISRRAHDASRRAETAIAPRKQTSLQASFPSPDMVAIGAPGGMRSIDQLSARHGDRQRAGEWPADDALMSAMGLGDYDESDPAAFAPGRSPASSATRDAAALALGADPLPSGTPVARSAASPGPAAAGAGAKASPAAKPEKKARPAPVPSTHEPSQHADWSEVAAAVESSGQEALDIEWINALPAPIRDSIDAKFSEKLRDQAVGGKIFAASSALDQEHQKRTRQLREQAAMRLDVDHPKRVRAAAIDADPDYVAAVKALDAEIDAKKQGAGTEVRDAYDAQRPTGRPEESVTTPPNAKVTRREGAARGRTDFMSWAIEMTGSADNAKAHYQSIRQVKGRKDLWLAADAAARLEAAIANFEAAHPGYTIGSAGGQSMRDLHQTRNGVGMHGHSLAFAIDILAYDNPNLKPEEKAPGPVNEFYLERFGRDAAGTSRATMNLAPNGDQRIEALGKHTAAGATTPADEQFVQDIHTQFAEISATSQRFQASMAAQLPDLQKARNMYFMNLELQKTLKQLQKDQSNTAALAKKQLAQEKVSGDAAAKAARLAQIEGDIKERLKEGIGALSTKKAKTAIWEKIMEDAFTEWTSILHQEADIAKIKLTEVTTRSQASQAALLELKALKNDIQQLTAFASAHRLTIGTEAPVARLRQKLEQALKKKKHDSDQQVAYSDKEINVLSYAIKRLRDPEMVFGKGKKNEDGTYSTKYEVSEVPLIQYLEHGNIRDDAMPAVASQGSGGRKGVFNAEVVATLARHGFSPGSAFGDTMHFDFIEGYTRTVPGGRSQTNMKRDRFGPRGTVTKGTP